MYTSKQLSVGNRLNPTKTTSNPDTQTLKTHKIKFWLTNRQQAQIEYKKKKQAFSPTVRLPCGSLRFVADFVHKICGVPTSNKE